MARLRSRSDDDGMLFRDRADAGALLADRVAEHQIAHPLVLGIATGGVVVAAEIARRLNADLDVIVVHRLGAPGLVDLTVGTVAGSGHFVLDPILLQALNLSPDGLQLLISAQSITAEQHQDALRGSRPALCATARPVIVVDDGMATGMTILAAIRSIRDRHPASLTVAVPVGSRAACVSLQAEVDELICLSEPEVFLAVGLYYRNFDPVEDEDVRRILHDARGNRTGGISPASIAVGE
jgi:putative phosphoribosyl transferase